jgi:hypothetical protein
MRVFDGLRQSGMQMTMLCTRVRTLLRVAKRFGKRQNLKTLPSQGSIGIRGRSGGNQLWDGRFHA